jgi:hypothetical protein
LQPARKLPESKQKSRHFGFIRMKLGLRLSQGAEKGQCNVETNRFRRIASGIPTAVKSGSEPFGGVGGGTAIADRDGTAICNA